MWGRFLRRVLSSVGQPTRRRALHACVALCERPNALLTYTLDETIVPGRAPALSTLTPRPGRVAAVSSDSPGVWDEKVPRAGDGQLEPRRPRTMSVQRHNMFFHSESFPYSCALIGRPADSPARTACRCRALRTHQHHADVRFRRFELPGPAMPLPRPQVPASAPIPQTLLVRVGGSETRGAPARSTACRCQPPR